MCPGNPSVILVNRDHSDLPADGSSLPNGTAGTTSYGDALHTVTSGTYLGGAVDYESSSIASNDATGDGTDDDGVFYGTMALSRYLSLPPPMHSREQPLPASVGQPLWGWMPPPLLMMVKWKTMP